MKAKNVIFSLALILAIVSFAIVKWRLWEPHKKEMLNRHPAHIEYTRNAECRMNCRNITRDDISIIIQKGVIIFNKSNMRTSPCPTFAIQGYSRGGENIRVILSQCNSITKIVTCYNLKKDFNCDCGEENDQSVTFSKINR